LLPFNPEVLPYRLLSKNVKIRIYRTTNFPVVLYGCGTWPLTLREEQSLRVFENRVLRIFGPKRDEVIGGSGKLHNEKLHNVYSSPNIIKMIKVTEDEVGVACITHVERGNVYRILVGKPEEKTTRKTKKLVVG
jgi:hypothetical protein